MDVVIAGAGALGRVMCDFLLAYGHNVVGFLDDNERIIGGEVNSILVHSFDDTDSFVENESSFIVTVMDGKSREYIVKRLLSHDCRFLDFQMQNCFFSPFSKIGKGCSFLTGAHVMNNAIIGNFCHVHMFTIIGHDAVVGDFCSFTPHCVIGGGSRIGQGVSFGMGANVIPNITIGDYSIIGAGTVVIRDVPANSIIFGNPGQIRGKRK